MDILGLRYVVAIDTDIMIVDHGVRTFISLYFSYSPMVSRDLRKLATISLINVRYDNSNVFWQRPALARCIVLSSDAGTGGARGATAPPIFGRSVNPIWTGEGRLSPPVTTGPPNVFHLPASLDNIFSYIGAKVSRQ